jgi:hypothetical protein
MVEFGDYCTYTVGGAPLSDSELREVGRRDEGFIIGLSNGVYDWVCIANDHYMGMTLHKDRCQIISKGHQEKALSLRNRYLRNVRGNPFYRLPAASEERDVDPNVSARSDG